MFVVDCDSAFIQEFLCIPQIAVAEIRDSFFCYYIKCRTFPLPSPFQSLGIFFEQNFRAWEKVPQSHVSRSDSIHPEDFSSERLVNCACV